ncbi:MAG: sulfur carrier protein ThiS [Amylibacter sp.]
MKINVNGKPQELKPGNLSDALAELGYGDAKIATAVNAAFVPAALRDTYALTEGDQLEILAPMQGG